MAEGKLSILVVEKLKKQLAICLSQNNVVTDP